ncbi:hypothetical protein [Streptococcus suis]|uniref:hypothetical protein n=1 Tax=Streptococcus suis TaxID=1307 RepID=UPI003757261F
MTKKKQLTGLVLATGLSVFGSEVQADEIVTATSPAEAEAVSSTTSSQPVTAQDVADAQAVVDDASQVARKPLIRQWRQRSRTGHDRIGSRSETERRVGMNNHVENKKDVNLIVAYKLGDRCNGEMLARSVLDAHYFHAMNNGGRVFLQ